jgi:diguanylate cyclase (GGDEF)-like protein
MAAIEAGRMIGSEVVAGDSSEMGLAMQRNGRLAGFLFIGGSLAAIPVRLFLDPQPETWTYLFPALGLLSGLVCLAVPWERLTETALHVVAVVAIVQIALGVAFIDQILNYLYFFVAVYVGLAFNSLRVIVGYAGLITAALLAPLVYDDYPARETLLWAVALGPGIVITATVIGWLTNRLEQSRQAYRRLSGVDALTGVGNYRALQERLWQETARHSRRKRKFALLALDLDGFKAVNETQGHLVGDLVLAVVGGMLGLEVRAEDMVFRPGGDEFSVLAPETSRKEAGNLADRLETSLSGIKAGDVRLTATVGTAIYPDDADDPAALTQEADAAMMARKGRTRRFARQH